ncbi:hypothetical protein K450DRAFT_224004 [Umbelopsis ramanniana AG]|uniref:Uncharacterized protein n=1 Tax=Umbelopsis ramanniana AG TaxID=1314678 RepID=A0AAD5EGM5_UMBRA|nr:uncharacterized protein K450DRAFT_224004 [Umbelopsis ramanniana AG]KAI8583057.1 hypothetical protein K450DRAFT_224004 [Umbelopsis ramanniana AG]
MNRTRDEVDDLLQKSRISRDMHQEESDYNPQRNYRPNSGEVFLSEPGLQTSSYHSSDVGGGSNLMSKDTSLYQNSPTLNLPGAFPTNSLDDNKRNNNSSLSRREQTEDYSGMNKNKGYSTDYTAGQIDNDPILRLKKDITYQTSPGATGDLNSNRATDQKDIDPTKRNQSQSISQPTDGSSLNAGSNVGDLKQDYTAGQINDDPTLGNKGSAAAISGPANAQTFGSTDMANNSKSTGNDTGMVKTSAAAAAVGGIGAKIGSILGRRKSKETELPKDSNLNTQTQDWKQGTDGRMSMDTQRPDVSSDSEPFGTEQSGSWNKQGQRYSLPATSSSYDKDLSGNLNNQGKDSDLSGVDTSLGTYQTGNLATQGDRGDLSGIKNSLATDQSGSLKMPQGQSGDLSGLKDTLKTDQYGSSTTQGQSGNLSGMKDSLDTDQYGSLKKPQGQRGDLSGLKDSSLDTDLYKDSTTQGQRGNLSGMKDSSLDTDLYKDSTTQGQRGNLSGMKDSSLDTDLYKDSTTQGQRGNLSGMKDSSLDTDLYKDSATQGQRGNLSGMKDSFGTNQYDSSKPQGQRGDLSGTDAAPGTGLSTKLKNQDNTTKPYDYDDSKLDTHKNLALNNETSSNAATYGSTDAPYDSGNLDKETEQEQPENHTGAKAVAAGATAGGIGAMLSSVLGRKKSAGDINNKTVDNQGSMSSSGNMTDGDMASGNLTSGNMLKEKPSSGRMPSGDIKPSGKMSVGSKPSGNLSGGIMPSGDMSSGNMPSGSMSAGSKPSVNAPNDSVYRSDNLSTATGNKPPNITTNDVSSPMVATTNTNDSLGAGGINSSNKGVSGTTNLNMNSPSPGNKDLSTLGIQTNQPDSIKGNLDNSRGMNTQNDRLNRSNDTEYLKPPSARSLTNNNEPISNGETVVDDKKRNKVSGIASYIFGHELKLQGSYKIFLSKFLHNEAMKNDGLELQRKGRHILDTYRRAQQHSALV